LINYELIPCSVLPGHSFYFNLFHLCVISSAFRISTLYLLNPPSLHAYCVIYSYVSPLRPALVLFCTGNQEPLHSTLWRNELHYFLLSIWSATS